MFGTAVIVFREMLEAALIVGIVAAATRDVPKRGRWIVAGVLCGLLGAAIVAGFTDRISQLASGVGQEIFNASVLGIAVLMLGWHKHLDVVAWRKACRERTQYRQCHS